MKGTLLGWCDRGQETARLPVGQGFYVTVGDGARQALLAGPFDRLEEALARIEPVETFAEDLGLAQADLRCSVCRAPTREPAPLNERIGVRAARA